jgi:site-specific recombinase XerD
MKKATDEAVVLSQLIHSFLTVYVPFQISQSENTVKSHETAISLYVNFLESEQGFTPETFGSKCFSRDMIEKWMLWLHVSRGCTTGTCNVRLASIRAFLGYVGGKEVSMLHLRQSASGIKRMKTMKKKVSGMSRNAVKALMDATDTSTPTGRRDLALIVTVYGTAARIDEVLSIKIQHLYLKTKDPYVIIVGKGNKLRSLYLLPKAVAHIERHITEFHGDNPDPEAFLFFSRNVGQYGKLTQSAVSKRLKMHATAAHESCKDIPLDIHFHQLRHAKASHWLEDGLNIMQISLLLGHEHLETTMIYLDISLEQKAEALGTLEDERCRDVQKKWKNTNTSLSSFCGFK